jgi:hypothetical protein
VKIGRTTRPYVRVLVMVVALTIVAGTTGAAEHIPQAVDARALEAMIIDQSTSSSLRAVATAIVNLTHTVTDADRRALHALLK